MKDQIGSNWTTLMGDLAYQPRLCTNDGVRNYNNLTLSAEGYNRDRNFSWLEDDSSQVLKLVLTGGPKWGFRIRQLNDNRIIVSRVDKGPGEKHGIRVNDEILSVNNVPLGDKPRSLLLTQQPVANTSANSAELDGGGMATINDKTPLLTQEAAAELGKIDAQQDTYLANVELSKLDFAYQLIRHSSLSNKLILGIKRYLNPAYARASVAVCQLGGQSTWLDRQQQLAGEFGQQTNKRSNGSSGIHYAYKCCECYCDNEGE